MDSLLADLSQQLGQALRERGLTLATAESCTGGWVAEVVTDTAGKLELVRPRLCYLFQSGQS